MPFAIEPLGTPVYNMEFGVSKPLPPKKPWTVYFLLTEDRSSVKIGITKNLKRRIHKLEVEHSLVLTLLHTVETHSPNLEKDIHDLFREERLAGEWFAFSDRMREFVEELPSTWGPCKSALRAV